MYIIYIVFVLIIFVLISFVLILFHVDVLNSMLSFVLDYTFIHFLIALKSFKIF